MKKMRFGAIYATVPTGCAQPIIGGITYYLCGNTGSNHRLAPTMSIIAWCQVREVDRISNDALLAVGRPPSLVSMPPSPGE